MAPDKNNNYSAALFIALLVIRMINALSIKTFFQPDEYFQSLEPAWQSAFGESSGAWITWVGLVLDDVEAVLIRSKEWREHLRSSIHPLLFAGVYKSALHLSNMVRASPRMRAEILIIAPKVQQAFFAAATDFFTYLLATKIYGPRHTASLAALALTAFNPWQWFCSVRTLSNSLETTLTIIALDMWPWAWFLEEAETTTEQDRTAAPRDKMDLEPEQMVNKFRDFLEAPKPSVSVITKSREQKLNLMSRTRTQKAQGNLCQSLLVAAMACILRPTNLIVWMTVSISLICRYGTLQNFVRIVPAAFLCGSLILTVSVGMDIAFYREWVFPPSKFLQFNVVQSLAVFYGKNRPDYYFTEGLPLLLTTALPFACVGMWQALRPGHDRSTFHGYEERQTRFTLALTVATSVITLSLISHKEVRFIYPLLPILHVLAARPVAAFFDPFPLSAKKVRLGLLLLGLTVNVYIAAYVGYVHQRGVIDVMHYLRQEQEARLILSSPEEPRLTGHPNMTVGFFMPCHSTPWRSHLIHPEISAWALTCEPPLNLTVPERQIYLDEADIFYAHPASWIDEYMKDRKTVMQTVLADPVGRPGDESRRAWPQYLIFFQHLEPIMNGILGSSRYQECWRGFNTHWHDDWRRRGDIVVWCLQS